MEAVWKAIPCGGEKTVITSIEEIKMRSIINQLFIYTLLLVFSLPILAANQPIYLLGNGGSPTHGGGGGGAGGKASSGTAGTPNTGVGAGGGGYGSTPVKGGSGIVAVRFVRQ